MLKKLNTIFHKKTKLCPHKEQWQAKFKSFILSKGEKTITVAINDEEMI